MRLSRGKPAKPRWLIIAPDVPCADQSGGDRRLFEILRTLVVTCEVSFLALRPRREDSSTYESALEALGVDLLDRGELSGFRATVRQGFDAVFFEFYHTTRPLLEAVRRYQPNALIIVDSVDVHFLREREEVRLGMRAADEAARAELLELETYRSADVTIVVSESERDALQALGVVNVEIVPIIVPIMQRERRERGMELLFIGGFNHQPNVFAVEWFSESIWPMIRAQVPAARWIIAGSNAPAAVLALDGHDGIDVLGFVPSTTPLLQQAQVSIAPLTYGGGVKVKVCEALAAGVPVVTTHWGAQGLEDGTNVAFLVADTAVEFAGAVIRLLTDSSARDQMSMHGQELAARKCTIEAAAPAISNLVQSSFGRRFGIWPLSRIRSFGVDVVRTALRAARG